MGLVAKSLPIISIGIIIILGFTTFSQAVIIDSADGTGNTSAPSGFPYWDSIGVAGGGSCVYIGNGYCLTAYHIKKLDWDTGHYSLTVNLGGVNYNIDNTTWTYFSFMGDTADLLEFRLTAIPAVPAVPKSTIITSMQPLNTPVWIIGHGFNRVAAKGYWDAGWNPVTPPAPYTYFGYDWDISGHTMRWGTNLISLRNILLQETVQGDNLTTLGYSATFDNGTSDNECMAVVGDSGGPVFICPISTNIWQLAGINLGANVPTNKAVYGFSSYFADLSAYTINVPGKAVTGTITLQNYTSSLAGQEVTIQIRNTGSTTPVETHVVALLSNGSYSFTTSLTGSRDLAAKGSHWLRQVKTNVNLNVSNPTANFTLINGDCNGDNFVTSDDISVILSAMDSMSGDPGWDFTADLDGDLEITSTDLSIVLLNMDIAGNP